MALTFRLTSPTIALVPEDGRMVARTVPFGAILTAEQSDGNRMVEVCWNDQKILMFAQDIRSRGEILSGGSDSD